MSNLKAETTEPDPAATSSPNEETVTKDAAMADTKSEAVNGESELTGEQTATKCEPVTEAREEKPEVKEEKPEVKQKNNESSGVKKERVYDDGVLKTSAKIDENRKNHSKYDPSVLPTSDDPSKIRAQVEFYFSDANLPTDTHLWNLTDGELNLPVNITEICKFGRMKRFQPISTVVAALRESSFLVVSGPEGQEQVKRKFAYDPTTPKSGAESRTVYVKGFGDEERSSQFDIEAFFAPYGPTNAVRLRRTDEKLFKGSVFVEFADEETAQSFLTLEPKPLWKGKYPLKVQSKKEYLATKIQEIKDGKIDPSEHSKWVNRNRGRGGYRSRGDRGNYRNDRDGRDRGRDRGQGDSRGDRDPDDWKKRREEDRASGFKDNHRKYDRGGHRDGDRKGRGRGRGRGRDDRGPRRDDRKRDGDEEEHNEKKRGREDEDGSDEKASKKVDIKSDESPAVKSEGSPATNGKKRAREEDESTEPSAKKVDIKSEVAVNAS